MAKRGRPPHPDILTPREWEVLALLREDLTNEQIAERLGITERTAKYHVAEILGKLGVSSRQEAAAWEPESGRPWWMSAAAPLLFWRRLRLGWLPGAAAGVAVVVVVAGLGVLVWGLFRTNGNIGNDRAAVATPSVRAAAPISTDGETDNLEIMGLDWAWAYADVDSLCDHADLVVQGVVARLRETEIERDVLDTPFSHYEFEVEEVVAGDLQERAVVLMQTGGSVDGRTVEARDDPLFEVGQRYVLFLRRDPGASGTYAVLGGPQGRFVVSEGKVSSLSSIYPDRRIFDLGLDGVPIGEFVSGLCRE